MAIGGPLEVRQGAAIEGPIRRPGGPAMMAAGDGRKPVMHLYGSMVMFGLRICCIVSYRGVEVILPKGRR